MLLVLMCAKENVMFWFWFIQTRNFFFHMFHYQVAFVWTRTFISLFLAHSSVYYSHRIWSERIFLPSFYFRIHTFLFPMYTSAYNLIIVFLCINKFIRNDFRARSIRVWFVLLNNTNTTTMKKKIRWWNE